MSEGSWESLTTEEFEDALTKGLGRAILHARQCMADRLLPAIEHALTRNLAHDPQCELIRVAYLADLADSAGGLARFRSLIFDRLPHAASSHDARQLRGLCGELARRGDTEARASLVRAFEASEAAGNEDGAFVDLLESQGRDGVLYVARTFGAHLREDPAHTPPDIRWFTNHELNEGDVERMLKELAVSDDHVKRYLEHIRERPDRRVPRPPRLADDQLQEMSFAELLRWVAGRSHPGTSVFKRWGRLADYSNLLDAVGAIEAESDPDTVRHALTCFWENPFVGEPVVLLGVFERFADHPRVTRVAENAIQLMASIEVRDAALDLIRNGQRLGRGLALLCANYQPGDWIEVAQALEHIVRDREQAHEAGQWLRDLFDEELTAEEPGAMLWTYENTPCSNCRESAFARLHESGRAPEWMYREMLADSSPDSRERARGFIQGDTGGP